MQDGGTGTEGAGSETVILGAGIVGLCVALSLLERGQAVRLIDRGDPGQATSFGNAGVIAPHSNAPHSAPGLWRALPGMLADPGKPLRVRAASWPAMIPWGLRFLARGRAAPFAAGAAAMHALCAPSIRLYRRHLEAAGQGGLIRDSLYIHAFRDPAQARLDAPGFRVRAAHGARMERVDGAGLRALEPAVSPDFRAAIVIEGQARALSPGRIGEVLAGRVRALGGVVERAEITGLVPAGAGWEVATGAGPRQAAQVVIAAGAWSGHLLAPLGIRLPLMAERGYHVEIPDPGVTLNHSFTDVGAAVVASSMEGGLRVAGMAEFGPLDAPPDPARAAILRRVARGICPDLADGEARIWMGRRPSLPDSLPALGRIAGRPGLWAAFGHSHHGLMMAPATGEAIAALITGADPGIDMAPYDPGRFG
ncbi:NAD(P)/FAD-dependent oxidoreductase [Mangrovicoccus algicola]|uniref:FAD-binding oxidoreductase n=1 Tax=Mangrovicoccus algicola TaxID=2771008 RepID=A0A8J7D155_9RHOB|nr:FAD-dependent oxidoreductase [Mangrovicoccus algicola]MBE3640363.1 FAD-binding oxidoreductase [Mangrovicoccus algicola]